MFHTHSHLIPIQACCLYKAGLKIVVSCSNIIVTVVIIQLLLLRTGAESGLLWLVSFDRSSDTGAIMWKWMSLFWRKNHLLRSWGWLSLVNWIEALSGNSQNPRFKRNTKKLLRGALTSQLCYLTQTQKEMLLAAKFGNGPIGRCKSFTLM